MRTPSASFQDVLARLRCHVVQLTLEFPITTLPNATLPVGRLVAVESDFIAIDEVVVDGIRLTGIPVVFIRLNNVFAVAPVNTGQMITSLALSLPRVDPHTT